MAKTDWEEASKEQILGLWKVSNLAYTCPMQELVFMKHLSFMKKTGMDHSSMLFLYQACSYISNHIASAIKSLLVKYVKSSEHSFSCIATAIYFLAK